MAAHQQVGKFEVKDEFGNLKKNGGNVASYFCTPDGHVIDAVLGPVRPDELLGEARWAVETYARCRRPDPVDTATGITVAHRETFEQLALDNAEPTRRRVHEFLAEHPFPRLEEVSQDVFRRLLGQALLDDDSAIGQALTAFDWAKERQLPMLFLLSERTDGATALREWTNRLTRDDDDGQAVAQLAGSYVVIALSADAMPALSQRLRLRPFAAPEPGTPLFAITRSNGRQVVGVAGWVRFGELPRAMALGLVQEAKERPRSVGQLRTLRAQVAAIDPGLGRQVDRLLAGAGRP